MADQKSWRHCNKCDKKHPSPTGKKCKGFYAEFYLKTDQENVTKESGGLFTAASDGAVGQHDSGKKPQAEDRTESRLDRLENMLSQLLLKDGQAAKPTLDLDSPFSSDSEMEDAIEPAVASKRGSKRRFLHSRVSC